MNLKMLHVFFLKELLNIPLGGQQNKYRNKFVKDSLQPLIDQAETERMAIVKAHAELGPDGEPLLSEDGSNSYKFATPAEKELTDKEYTEKVWQKEVTVGTGDEDVFKVVKKLVLNIDRKFMTKDGLVYDEICEAFEK